MGRNLHAIAVSNPRPSDRSAVRRRTAGTGTGVACARDAATRPRAMLRVLAVAAAIIVLAAGCVNEESGAPSNGSTPAGSSPGGGDPPGLRTGAIETDTPPAVAPAGSWAAAVPGTDAYLAVVSNGRDMLAYFCDSTTVSSWMSTSLTGAPVSAVGADGTTISTELVDGDLTVDLAPAGGEPIRMTLPRADDVLYRAEESLPADAASGSVGPEDEKPNPGRVLAGWIVLPDGSQRGSLATFTSTPKTATTTTSTTTSTASPTNLVTAAPRLTSSTSSLITTTPIQLTPTVTALPNPITPTALGAGVPNRSAEFVMVTLGDSYAAGEGNPNVAGGFDADGNLRTGASREQWSQQPPGHPEVETCHRSDTAAAPLVAADLQSAFPDVRVIHQSFACSGAKIENLRATTYKGADNQFDINVTPQTQQVRNWFNGVGPVRFPGTQKKIDALYMNVGGNDFGFSGIIGSCIAPLSNCSTDQAVATGIEDTKRKFPTLYRDLGTDLRNLAVSDGATTRAVAPKKVYISQIPSPLRDQAGALCDGAVHPRMKDDKGGLVNLSNLSRAEAAWAETDVLQPLNAAIAAAGVDNGWTVIDTIPAASRLHGVCSTNPWINNAGDALKRQGKDVRLDGLAYVLQGTLFLNLSAGMVHPNAAGFRGMANEITPKVRPQVVTTMTPRTPTRLRVGTVVRNGDIELRWDDVSDIESRFEIEDFPLENGQFVTFPFFPVKAAQQSVTIDLSGGPYTARYRIRACGPKQGNELCSPWSEPIVASNVPPKAPSNVQFTMSGSAGRVTFTDNAGPLQIGGSAAMALSVRSSTGQTSRLVRAATSTATAATFSLPAGTWTLTLRSCNASGCSAEIGSATVTV